jgi:hypothetical protein
MMGNIFSKDAYRRASLISSDVVEHIKMEINWKIRWKTSGESNLKV